jgi:hypothetical protein
MVRSRREQVTTAACSSRASVCTGGARRATMIPMHAHVCDGTRKGLVGAQDAELRQGGQRRREAAGDRIETQPPAAQLQPVRSPPRHMAHAKGSWAHSQESAFRADSDEGRLPAILLDSKLLRHSPSPPAAQPQPVCNPPRHTAHAEGSWAHRPVSFVRADSDEGRLPVIALEYKCLRHSPTRLQPAEAHGPRRSRGRTAQRASSGRTVTRAGCR